jgi:hypothetical protein
MAEAEALAFNISVPSDGLQGQSRLEKLAASGGGIQGDDITFSVRTMLDKSEHSLPGSLAALKPIEKEIGVAPLGSLSFVALSLSLFILSILFILGFWVSRMARRLLFQRPFDAF